MLEGADLRELRHVRLRDAALLDVRDLGDRLPVQDLRPHLDGECRLDLRRLRAGAVLLTRLDRAVSQLAPWLGQAHSEAIAAE